MAFGSDRRDLECGSPPGAGAEPRSLRQERDQCACTTVYQTKFINTTTHQHNNNMKDAELQEKNTPTDKQLIIFENQFEKKSFVAK